MELSEVGKILKKYRDAESLSIRRQAEKLGIGASYLCDISYGNRGMTINVLKKILKAYKYQCVGQDFITLSSACFDTDMFNRYKLRNHISDSSQAARDFIFVLTGDII